jgi:membrane protease YdiL (CAAX protease family)
MTEEESMSQNLSETNLSFGPKRLLNSLLIIAGLLAFVALFVLVDDAYFQFANSRFPSVGASAWLASLWGVISRAHLLILIIPLVVWKPRAFGFQTGTIRQHGGMLLIMLLANCGVIAAYLWLTHSSTPYSGNQWLVTEVVTVPLVEEIFWRGLVFSTLLLLLGKLYPANISQTLAVWLSGLAFGLLHANNLIAGVPLQFVAIQVLNATIWGIVYGYARAKTASIYPSIFLHAAMNLVVILF